MTLCSQANINQLSHKKRLFLKANINQLSHKKKLFLKKERKREKWNIERTYIVRPLEKKMSKYSSLFFPSPHIPTGCVLRKSHLTLHILYIIANVMWHDKQLWLRIMSTAGATLWSFSFRKHIQVIKKLFLKKKKKIKKFMQYIYLQDRNFILV